MSEQKLNREQRRAQGKKKPLGPIANKPTKKQEKPWHFKRDPFHLGRLVG